MSYRYTFKNHQESQEYQIRCAGERTIESILSFLLETNEYNYLQEKHFNIYTEHKELMCSYKNGNFIINDDYLKKKFTGGTFNFFFILPDESDSGRKSDGELQKNAEPTGGQKQEPIILNEAPTLIDDKDAHLKQPEPSKKKKPSLDPFPANYITHPALSSISMDTELIQSRSPDSLFANSVKYLIDLTFLPVIMRRIIIGCVFGIGEFATEALLYYVPGWNTLYWIQFVSFSISLVLNLILWYVMKKCNFDAVVPPPPKYDDKTAKKAIIQTVVFLLLLIVPTLLLYVYKFYLASRITLTVIVIGFVIFVPVLNGTCCREYQPIKIS